MKQQTPPIDKLIKQYIPSWEKRRRELAARENYSAQPVNSKPPAPAEPERAKQVEMPYIYKHDSDTSLQQGMLKMKHAYTWMKDANLTPVPDMLFDEFWRKEELCVLFSDGDIDRSVLAVQIADSISRGAGAGPFKTESKSQAVLYIDVEHSAKQFEGRYSKNYKEHYQFHPNFLRAEINPGFADDGQTSFEDSIIDSITRTIKASDAKILIIDNLTWLGEMMGKANKAQVLMAKLKQLKIKYGLSILVLVTTTVKPGKPITRADVQKRNGLLNLCDSAFCIGESTIAPNRFYVKQLRCRSTEMVYTRDNVCVCEIKKEHNFKQFAFLQYSNERIELLNQKHRQHLTDYLKIMELKKQGNSNVDIARMYGVTEGSIRLWLKRGEDKYGVIPGYEEKATNPTRGYHPPTPSLEEEGGGDVWSDKNTTNPTSTTSDVNNVPAGVIDPFGDFPGNEDLQADTVNAEGVQNPSGVKKPTNPTTLRHADFISASQRETLKQSRYLSGQGDGSATNPTNYELSKTEERELLSAAA